MRKLFISNKELRVILGVSESTISRVSKGNAKKDNTLKNIKPIYVGEARRWRVSDVANAIGITVEEIDDILK